MRRLLPILFIVGCATVAFPEEPTDEWYSSCMSTYGSEEEFQKCTLKWTEWLLAELPNLDDRPDEGEWTEPECNCCCQE